MSRGTIPAFNPGDPIAAVRQLAEAISQPLYGVLIQAGAESGANVRRFSFQVVNRQRFALPGRFLVRLWFSTTEYGAPAAGLTLAIVATKGVLHRTLTANQELEVMSNTAGLIEIDATIVGAATYYAHAVVQPVEVGAAAVWV